MSDVLHENNDTGIHLIRFQSPPAGYLDGQMTVRLSRLLGPSRALELICTATTVNPEKANQLGMINRLVADSLAGSRSIAEKICTLPASGIAAVKHIVRSAADMGVEDALSLEQREVNRRLGSKEVCEALARYIDVNADLRYPLS